MRALFQPRIPEPENELQAIVKGAGRVILIDPSDKSIEVHVVLESILPKEGNGTSPGGGIMQHEPQDMGDGVVPVTYDVFTAGKLGMGVGPERLLRETTSETIMHGGEGDSFLEAYPSVARSKTFARRDACHKRLVRGSLRHVNRFPRPTNNALSVSVMKESGHLFHLCVENTFLLSVESGVEHERSAHLGVGSTGGRRGRGRDGLHGDGQGGGLSGS